MTSDIQRLDRYYFIQIYFTNHYTFQQLKGQKFPEKSVHENGLKERLLIKELETRHFHKKSNEGSIVDSIKILYIRENRGLVKIYWKGLIEFT